jgi:hypothetical protein
MEDGGAGPQPTAPPRRHQRSSHARGSGRCARARSAPWPPTPEHSTGEPSPASPHARSTGPRTPRARARASARACAWVRLGWPARVSARERPRGGIGPARLARPAGLGRGRPAPAPPKTLALSRMEAGPRHAECGGSKGGPCMFLWRQGSRPSRAPPHGGSWEAAARLGLCLGRRRGGRVFCLVCVGVTGGLAATGWRGWGMGGWGADGAGLAGGVRRRRRRRPPQGATPTPARARRAVPPRPAPAPPHGPSHGPPRPPPPSALTPGGVAQVGG